MALDLAFEVVGTGDPLVVLHGLLGSKTNWRSIAHALAPTRQVFCLDLRNHGASPWADWMGYEEMADDVLRFLDGRGLERTALLGHSMGGKVAMTLALRHPKRVGQLVVVDIAPVDYDDRLSPVAEAMRAADVWHAASREEVRQRLAVWLPDAGVVGFVMQNLEARNAHFDWRVNLGTILASIPDLVGFPWALRALHYGGPMYVIAGGKSDYVTAGDGAEFRPMFEPVAVEFIPSAGHWVHAERPAEFLAALGRALSMDTAAALR